MDLSTKIEAILFFTGEPMMIGELAKMLQASEDEIKESVTGLREKLTGRGIALMENGPELALRTHPALSDLIMTIRKEELEKDLGKAGLETLALILYQGPITRARIDYVRGVNSTFIIRQLMVRGLVERIDNPVDQRSFLYKPTLELLSFLGLSSVSDLPDAHTIREELASFEARATEPTDASDPPSTKPSDEPDRSIEQENG